MKKIPESIAAKVVEPEPEPKFVEAPEPESEVKESEVDELHSETLIDLPAEPTMKLVPSLTAIRALLFLRSLDLYNPLQIFLQETHRRLAP